MIPAKPLDRTISNIKYRLVKYYVRMGLTPHPPKIRVFRDFSNPPLFPRDPYVINEWPLTPFMYETRCLFRFPLFTSALLVAQHPLCPMAYTCIPQAVFLAVHSSLMLFPVLFGLTHFIIYFICNLFFTDTCISNATV